MSSTLTDLTAELVCALDNGWPTHRIVTAIGAALPAAAEDLNAINSGGVEIGQQPATSPAGVTTAA